MRLAVDASVLVAEALRARGRLLILRPSLDPWLASEAWSETQHELQKRLAAISERAHIQLPAAERLLNTATETIESAVTTVDSNVLADLLPVARRRMPRDPRDAPTVALALGLQCGIWTADYDFFGCGVAVWSTEALL